MKHETKVPLYNISIFMTNKLNALNKRIRKDVSDYDGGSKCYGRCTVWSDADFKMHIGIYASSLPIISHEAVHAANDIFDKIGQKPDLRNDECYAYLVEWIVKEFIEHIDI